MRSKEQDRLDESQKENAPVHHWQKWGPYLSERSWGTVREDYSESGDAWRYFPFWEAHKKAYRWGEDGIAGWTDRFQVLALAMAFWNGKDPILKERLFGLDMWEGNHGEDVKECYFYLDGTPTHSYMKFLYKYPQAEFPYHLLKQENERRTVLDSEFELVDTGVFNENRYFDIFIEYAKDSPEDTCVRVEAFNRGPEAAPLHILPQLWFRNQWGWNEQRQPEPSIKERKGESALRCFEADDTSLVSPSNLNYDYHLGKLYFYGPMEGQPLFTNNESYYSGQRYVKEGIHEAVIRGKDSVNPDNSGTKAALHYFYKSIPAGESVILHFRLTPNQMTAPLDDVDRIVTLRKEEADAFYATIHPKQASAEEKKIQRGALAGLLWNKQSYLFDVSVWLDGDNAKAPPPYSRHLMRNIHWRHLNSMRVMLMPDKWEFPWFAAWDLAFQTVSFGLIDSEFAKEQLWLLLFDQFQHPNGQIPSYEWEFSDRNPPIQAWAALRLYFMEKKKKGQGDVEFLNRCFLKLMLNFVWWVNKVDSNGLNVFEGGFLGLDNIAHMDRSIELEAGIVLRQSDGTGWMAMFSLNLMRMALELAKNGIKGYESLATKFFQHFVYIVYAMKKRGNINYEMWSEMDHFFYDAISYADGTFHKLRVRSLVGLIPLFATEILSKEELDLFPEFKKNFLWFLDKRHSMTQDCIVETSENYILCPVNESQLKGVLNYVSDPEEFRSSFGLRSLSKFHEKHPFYFRNFKIEYEPGISRNKIKGGNSNWRGPVWMPTTFLLVEAIRKLASAYGENFKIEVEGHESISLEGIADDLTQGVKKIFQPDREGLRPFYGADFPFSKDPHWDHLLFYEYFDSETGQGLGASHQTGWTALIANFIDEMKERDYQKD